MTLEKFANDGGMLPEQLWDTDDLPGGKMKRGYPTGSAMPLCWSHAEYVTLVRSHKDGVCFDRIEPVYKRYVKAGKGGKIDMWTFEHQLPRVSQGKTLRIITEKATKIRWSLDGWATANDMETRDTGFGCWFADLPSGKLQVGAGIVFTFLWQEGWGGKIFRWRLLSLCQGMSAGNRENQQRVKI
jgi:glucoamylase